MCAGDPSRFPADLTSSLGAKQPQRTKLAARSCGRPRSMRTAPPRVGVGGLCGAWGCAPVNAASEGVGDRRGSREAADGED